MLPSHSQVVEDRLWGKGKEATAPKQPPGRKPGHALTPEAVERRESTKQQQRTAEKQQRLEQVRDRAVLPTLASTHGLKVPVHQLLVEHSFQRPLVESRVYDMAFNYDEKLFGELCVAELHEDHRFLGYSLLDGQHRKAVAELLLFQEVPVENLGLLPYEERARVFRERNDKRTALSFGMLFKAMLEEKKPEAVVLTRVLKEFSLELDLVHEKGPKARGILRSPRTVWDMFRSGGVVGLRRVLGTIQSAWGLEPEAYQSDVLWGFHSFFYRYPQADQKRLLDILRRSSVQELWNTAAERAPTLQRERAVAIAFALHYLYNYRRTQHRLPEFVYSRVGRRASSAEATHA